MLVRHPDFTYNAACEEYWLTGLLFSLVDTRSDMAGDVLVIGDCTVSQTLEPALEDAGYNVVGARDSLDGLQHLRRGTHHIVILSGDASLTENMSLLSLVKRQTSTPVIVVGSGDKQAVVDSLTQGADVHLARTTSVRVVLAHLRALLRRHSPFTDSLD